MHFSQCKPTGKSVAWPRCIMWWCSDTVWLLQKLASKPDALPGGLACTKKSFLALFLLPGYVVHWLCPNSGSASLGGRTAPREGCPSSKAPPNAAHEGSFFSLFLEDAQLLSFMASHIPRFFVLPKKKKEREKMATSHGVDHHFWWHNQEMLKRLDCPI